MFLHVIIIKNSFVLLYKSR